MNGASRPALIRAEGRPLAKPPLAVRGQSSGKSHLLMARRAGQLRIRQRIPGSHAWPGYPRRHGNRAALAAAERNIRHLTADGTSGFSAQDVVRGTGEDGRSAGGGKRLTATAVPGVKDLRWWPEASPLPTPGPFPCHVAFVVDRLLLRSTPVGGTLGKNSGKFDFGFFCCGPGTFLPASGALESAARCLRQIEFSRICAE